MEATLLDYVIYGSLGLNALLLLFLFLVHKYAWTVTLKFIRAGISGVNTIGLRWTTNRKVEFDLPHFDPKDRENLYYKVGGQDVKCQIIKGSFGIGPDRMDMYYTTDTMGSTIDMDAVVKGQKVGPTSAYLSAQNDIAYSRGIKEGQDRMYGRDWLNWVQTNWAPLIIMVIIVGIAITQFGDKLYTGPAGWQQANRCEQDKQSIIAKCSPYISVISPQTQLVPQNNTSNTGAKVT